jgi:PAS domain S-box-containing protein
MQNLDNGPGLGKQRFHDLMAQAPVAMSVLRGYDMVIESANSMMLVVWGKTTDVINKPLLEGLPELKGQPYINILHDVYTTGKTYYGNEAKVLLMRNGVVERCYFNFVYQPITGPDEHVNSIMVVAMEVTQQVIARIKMEDAEERLRLATEATGLGTWDLDLQSGNIIHSPRLAEIFGRNNRRVLRRAELNNIVHPADLDMVNKAFNEALATGVYFYEARVIWPDGSVHWVRTTGKVIYDDNQAPLRMLGTIKDITEQKHMLDELLKSEENLRLATEAAELGTFDMDVVNHSLVWDHRCRELFGITNNEPVSYENTFLLGLHPDDREKTDDAVCQALNKKISDGDFDVEYRTIGAEDKKLRWVRAKGKVMFNEQDMPLRLIGAVLDITENKQNELKKNDFIAMASHELKTPLTSLKAYIQLLLANARRTGDSFLVNALEKSDSQISKMTKLIHGFLDLAKLESGKLALNMEVFDITKLIEEIIDDSRPISQGHDIVFENRSVININADREKIGQVISNFISNAIKYSPKSTSVIVELITTDNDVKVKVTDNGIGIKQTDQQNIFHRFYRVENASTKGFSGFGIGLYLSAEIINLHNGKIGVYSEEGKGSTFHFTLPITQTAL